VRSPAGALSSAASYHGEVDAGLRRKAHHRVGALLQIARRHVEIDDGGVDVLTRLAGPVVQTHRCTARQQRQPAQEAAEAVVGDGDARGAGRRHKARSQRIGAGGVRPGIDEEQEERAHRS
jgi:hypothetical protein